LQGRECEHWEYKARDRGCAACISVAQHPIQRGAHFAVRTAGQQNHRLDLEYMF